MGQVKSSKLQIKRHHGTSASVIKLGLMLYAEPESKKPNLLLDILLISHESIYPASCVMGNTGEG